MQHVKQKCRKKFGVKLVSQVINSYYLAYFYESLILALSHPPGEVRVLHEVVMERPVGRQEWETRLTSLESLGNDRCLLSEGGAEVFLW